MVMSGYEKDKPSNGVVGVVAALGGLVLVAAAVGSGGDLDRPIVPQSEPTQEESYVPPTAPDPVAEAAKLLCANAFAENRLTGNYIVKEGEVLSQIAADTMPGTDQALEKMKAANDMDDAEANGIEVGQIIGIPPADCTL